MNAAIVDSLIQLSNRDGRRARRQVIGVIVR